MHFAGHMQFATLGVDEVDRMALGILGIISYIVHLTSEQEYPGWTFADFFIWDCWRYAFPRAC